MRKVLWLIVCLMTMVLSVKAQDYKDVKYHKIKEAAINGFKETLIAPSQFVLADRNGNKLSIDDLYVSVENETSDTIRKEKSDSIITYKKTYRKCWAVLVEGDAMNQMGGYKHTSGLVYVYGSENYAYANYPYNEKKFEFVKIKAKPKEKTKVEVASINWENEHSQKHTKGIDIPFRFKGLGFGSIIAFTHILCPLCQQEFEDLGERDYKTLVSQRQKCKEYKEYKKVQAQKEKDEYKIRKENRASKINKYLTDGVKLTEKDVDDMYF